MRFNGLKTKNFKNLKTKNFNEKKVNNIDQSNYYLRIKNQISKKLKKS